MIRPYAYNTEGIQPGDGVIPECVCDVCGHSWRTTPRRGAVLQGLIKVPDKCPACSTLRWNNGVEWVPPLTVADRENLPPPCEQPDTRQPGFVFQPQPEGFIFRRPVDHERRAAEIMASRHGRRALLMALTPVMFRVTQTAVAGVRRGPGIVEPYGMVPCGLDPKGSSPGVVC